MSNSRQRLLYSSIGLVLLLLLAGCAGFGPTDGEGPTDTPTVESDVDTSGDGIPDQTAEELGLNPDQEYDEQFVDILHQIREEDPHAAQTFASHFATDDGVSNEQYPALENFSILIEQHPGAIQNMSQQLLDGNSKEFVDKQLGVLRQVDVDNRETILESKDLSDDDWANSGLKNWEEIEHETDILAADTSGDGLPDGPSVHNDSTYPDADPLQKDVYVEINRVSGSDISNSDLRKIEREFDNAPIENPDGTEGVNVHLIENKVIDDPNWQLTDLGEHSDYTRKGYHYIVIADRGAVQDAAGIAYTSTAAVEDHGSPRTGAIFIHELGHLLGIGDELHGVDSEQVSFNDYESVMNYNSPSNYYGFSDGSDSTKGAYDWKHIECAMASQAQRGMFSRSVPFDSETLSAAQAEATPLYECVFGYKITSNLDRLYIQMEDINSVYNNVDEVEEEIAEENSDSDRTLEYEIIDESGIQDSTDLNVTVINTGDYAETQTVKFTPQFGTADAADSQSKTVSLDPNEKTEVSFEIRLHELRESESHSVSQNAMLYYKIETDDHTRHFIVHGLEK